MPRRDFYHNAFKLIDDVRMKIVLYDPIEKNIDAWKE